MKDVPPWGSNENNPWKEFDLFEEWARSKNLKYIDISDARTLIELWEICCDVFVHDRELKSEDYSEIPN